MRKFKIVLTESYHGRNGLTRIGVRCVICNHCWRPLISNVLYGGGGCPHCSSFKLATADVAERLRRSGITLISHYRNSRSRVKVRCMKCRHSWRPIASQLLQGCGCPRCNSVVLTPEAISKRLSHRQLSLSGVYRGSQNPIRLRCVLCDHQWQIKRAAYAFQSWLRCPKCYPDKFGREEDRIRKIIEKLTGWKFPKAHPKWLRGRGGQLELDDYNEKHKIAFEYQGQQHYRARADWSNGDQLLAANKRRDHRKRCLCYYHGVLLIRVPYWKKDVKAFLQQKLRPVVA